MTKNRIVYLDIAKIIALFLVVIGHAMPDSPTHVWLYSFHMPLFFFIAGLTYKEATIASTIKKSFLRLIVPYIVLQLLLIILHCSISIACGNLQRDVLLSYTWTQCRGIIQGYPSSTIPMPSGPCWFLLALFFSRIIVCIATQYRSPKWRISAVFICCIFSYFCATFPILKIWSLSPAIICSVFMLAGYFFQRFYHASLEQHRVLSLAILLPLWLLGAAHNGLVDLYKSEVGHSLLLCYLAGISGSIAFCLICSFITYSGKVLASISAAAICILALHMDIYSYLCFFLRKMCDLTPNHLFSFSERFLICIGAYTICIAFATLLPKQTNIFFGK